MPLADKRAGGQQPAEAIAAPLSELGLSRPHRT
jgi:hypothetical protein